MPCGYYGDPVKSCTCSSMVVTKYQKRIVGGPKKFQAIPGVLRGKLINVLITDSINAEKLLQ